MSSLVTSASVWTNDENNNTRKRQSTMRKTIKLRSEQSESSNYDETTPELDKYGKMTPQTINDQQNYNENRNIRINDLLNKMTSVDNGTNSDVMGDFKPMKPPSLNVKKDMDNDTEVKQYIPPLPSYLKATIDRSNNSISQSPQINYGFSENSSNSYSNYQRSYEPPTQLSNKPYYANMGITSSGQFASSDKILEKINYMIHMLEESHNERTNNITEEFILYTFLGIFIIFVVDSFSKSGGKYVR